MAVQSVAYRNNPDYNIGIITLLGYFLPVWTVWVAMRVFVCSDQTPGSLEWTLYCGKSDEDMSILMRMATVSKPSIALPAISRRGVC